MADPGEPAGQRGLADLFAELERLTEANQQGRDLERERSLLQLRFAAGVRLLTASNGSPEYARPTTESLPSDGGLPSFTPADLTPTRLRAAILRDGCMIVRGLVASDLAERLAAEIEHAFSERSRKNAGQDWDRAYYEPFRAVGPLGTIQRPFIEKGGGLLVADSPRLSCDLLELLEAAGIAQLAAGYLNEPVALSVSKSTFRKVEPTVSGGWHQDGSFMGPVRSLNVWLALSECGEDAPSLDIVPRRLDELAERGTEGTYLSTQVSQATAEAAADDREIARPTFAPGDAVLFDELCLHQTGSDPSMRKPRYASETWFFGVSAFPDGYGPLALAGGRHVDQGVLIS